MIERLAAALATTAGLSAEEVLDVLLLCGRRPLPEEPLRPDAAAPSSAAPPVASEPAPTPTPPDAPPPAPEPVAPPAPELRLPPEHADADLRPATEAGFEAPAAIGDLSALPRALRRFRRVRTRGHRLSIDIEATADATAEARGRLVLVHTQEAEHALDVVLVADDGPGMRIWDDTLDAFARLLTQSGAFRTVTRCRLAHTPTGPRLRDGRGMLHPPRYIVDPSGHRVVLVATDATAEAWYHPPVWAALATWCRAMPTAILHMLPDRYWGRTAIGDPYLAARARRPGGPNQHYEQRLAWWAEAPRGVPLPVLTLATESLRNWAEAAVDGVVWSDAISVDPPELAYAPSRADTSDPQALVNAFRALASDGAEHLAHTFAMAPVLSLPLMRILQDALVPTTGTPELAEVLAAGLFRPAGHVEGGRLRFHYGVRELLAQGTTSFDEWSAYDAVTRYLGERGYSPGPLRALVADPAGRAFLDPDDRPFAELHTHLAERFASGSGGGSSRQGRARERGDESEHHDVRPREVTTAGPTARPRAGRTGPGRRFLIAIGVGQYREPDLSDLPGAEADAGRVRGLLEPMGYRSVLTDRSVSPTRSDLAHGMEEWVMEASLGPEDVVVVYFTGHAVTHQDRHYLLGADSRVGLWSTALTAEDLVRPLMTSGVGHLLVMLDTCFAEAGTVDVGRLAAEPANHRRERVNRWCLATARGPAWQNAFVDALTDVFANPRHGATQQFLSVREVTERVNAHFMIHHPDQQARTAAFQTDGQEPFFPSPLFLPGLPADGIDLASLAQLRHRHTEHFGPRGRGLEHAGERGDYFTGRTRALRELSAYLSTPGRDHDRKARVVTGDPGSGKSALLGRLLALSDPAAGAARETSRAVDPWLPVQSLIALHAYRVTLDDLVADLASTLNLPDPADRDDILTALAARTAPVGIVVDSLDGAGTADTPEEGNRIARELLQPLSTMPLVRLIVGTRRPQIPALGPAVAVIDLDEPGYADPSDMAAYARALLEDAQDPDSRSPYHHRPDLAATIARGIAERAGSSYLVARMTARALVQGQIHIDTTQPGWRERLPQDATEAFAAYLDRFGPDRPKVERLLRPLVYAQGAGLPWSTLWGPLAEALSGLPCAQDDLEWLHRHVGAYIIETPTPDGSAYRLFHESMVEHLRRPGRVRDDHAAIAGTLIALVTTDPITGVRDWPAAHPYIRRHIATHAAAGGTLPTLLDDPEYLVHAEPAPLLRALGEVAESALLPAAVYGASATVHATMAPAARRDILAIDAARIRQPDLAARFARTRPWVPRWATVTQDDPARRVIFTPLANPMLSVATTEIDGRPYVLSGSDDGRVGVWDLVTGTERPVPTGPTGAVLAVATVRIDGRPHAVTGSDDGGVGLWDLTTGVVHAPLRGPTGAVLAVATVRIDGRPHAVTGGADSTASVWDLTTGTERAILRGHTGAVRAVATTVIDGRPHAVTGSDDGEVRLWDLTTGVVHAVLTGHTGAVLAVATVRIDGRPHAVTGGADSTASVRDLTTGTERAVLTGHTGAVLAVATVRIDGRPHAVTGSVDSTARVWDLLSDSVVAVLSQPLPVRAVMAYGSDLILRLADVVVMLRRNAGSGLLGSSDVSVESPTSESPAWPHS
ncbi:SAV_2336 N-terminal domain-related protein [Streptomyces sp. NPDC057690]|uniref:SAV_2336 N-terminal domain-related protein n=1 Tax=Streptomyces sp. NPDC057690 TaxID=3346214 RepID=UPI0036BE32ED